MATVELSLAGETRSAGVARRFLLDTLSGWGALEYEEAAALLLGELVANAALHARTEIVVRLRLVPGRLRVEVADGSPRQPITRHYSAQATTGRGLGLVAALCERWGVEPNGRGKTVWAEIGPEAPAGTRLFLGDGEPDLSAFPDLEDLPGAPEPGSPSASGPSALRPAA